MIYAGCQARKSFSDEQSCCGFDGKVKIDLHWSLYRDRFRCINPEARWDRRRVETLFDTEMTLIAQEELLMILSYC